MDWRTISTYTFRFTRTEHSALAFKQRDIILTKEQSVLTKIMSSFEGENTKTQYKVLSYRIDYIGFS